VKVIITGSRDWEKIAPIAAMMIGLNSSETEFVFGDCPTGADKFALKVAENHKFKHVKVVAKWDELGKAAGPERNGRMIQHCLASKELTVCFAFRSEGVSNGTDDCVYQANVANIPTYIMRKMPDLSKTDYIVPGINYKRKAKNHG
jgi:hypothetical protein